MRSIRTRLTVWYAVSATATLAILFAAGYRLLETQLSESLDRLVAGEFTEIKARLGDQAAHIGPEALARQMSELSAYSSTLFYVEIEVPRTGINFRSPNLLGHSIPDVRGQRIYDATVEGVGEMRAHEFLLQPYDVTIATPVEQLRGSMRAYARVCIALLLSMALLSIAIGLGLSTLLLKPLRLITDTARRIRSDNLSERILVSNTDDEVGILATMLNQTFDRIESAFDQIRRFSDEASHELKTPLTLVRLHAEKMLGDADLKPTHVEAVIEQLEELRRLNQIIDELLFLSRAEAEAIVFDMALHDPTRFIASFTPDAEVLAEHYRCRFRWVAEGEGDVTFDAKWIRQVLLNGLTNAINVSPPDGLVTLHSSRTHGDWLVSISDEGPGLSPEQRVAMFDRFKRFGVPRQGDRGSGLGLAISRTIVEAHRGRIYAEGNPAGHGLRLVFRIPAKPAPAQGPPDQAASYRQPRR